MKKAVVKWLYGLVDDDDLRHLVIKHKVPVAGFDNNIAKAPRDRLIQSLSQGRKLPKILKELRRLVTDVPEEDLLPLFEIELENMLKTKEEDLPGLLISLLTHNDPQYHTMAESLYNEFKKDNEITNRIRASITRRKSPSPKRRSNANPEKHNIEEVDQNDIGQKSINIQEKLNKAQQVIKKQRLLIASGREKRKQEVNALRSVIDQLNNNDKELANKLTKVQGQLDDKNRENLVLQKEYESLKKLTDSYVEEKRSLEEVIGNLKTKIDELTLQVPNEKEYSIRIAVVGGERAGLLCEGYSFLNYINEEMLDDLEEGSFDQYEKVLLSCDTCTTLAQIKVSRMADDKSKIFTTTGRMIQYLEGIA